MFSNSVPKARADLSAEEQKVIAVPEVGMIRADKHHQKPKI